MGLKEDAGKNMIFGVEQLAIIVIYINNMLKEVNNPVFACKNASSRK